LQHLEGQAVIASGARPGPEPGQESGEGRPDVHDGAGRFPEALHRPPTAAVQDGLYVHGAKRLLQGRARDWHQFDQGGAGDLDPGDDRRGVYNGVTGPPKRDQGLCKDQALRSAVLALMPTLDEGGLVVRQVGGDPNRGIHIPGTSPDRQQRADQGPGGSSHGGPAPAEKGKGKEPEPERRHKQNVGATPTWRHDEARGAATIRSSQEEGSRSWRLQHGDGSFVGEPAPKRQKTAKAGEWDLHRARKKVPPVHHLWLVLLRGLWTELGTSATSSAATSAAATTSSAAGSAGGASAMASGAAAAAGTSASQRVERPPPGVWLRPPGVRPPASDLRVQTLPVLAGVEPLLVLSPTSQQGKMELARGRTPRPANHQ
jgi:hypothetical protein